LDVETLGGNGRRSPRLDQVAPRVWMPIRHDSTVRVQSVPHCTYGKVKKSKVYW
jgi:hypothetical protein